jgi:hypothetical protein
VTGSFVVLGFVEHEESEIAYVEHPVLHASESAHHQRAVEAARWLSRDYADGKPIVYPMAMTPKMIKVDERTHARLAELAAEHSTTIGGYVGELARGQRTHAEWEALGQQTQDYLREHFDFEPTPQERAELEAEHAAIMAGLDAQFVARRGARRASA